MTKPQCLRDIVIDHYKANKTAIQIYTMLLNKVSVRIIRRWIASFKSNGQTKPQVSSGRPLSVPLNKRNEIIRLLRDRKTANAISRKVKIARTTVQRFIKSRKLKVICFILLFSNFKF
jgi:transposase